MALVSKLKTFRSRSSKERQKTVSDTLQEVASPNNVNSNKCESENLSENSGTKLTSTTIDDADMYMKEESHTEKEGKLQCLIMCFHVIPRVIFLCLQNHFLFGSNLSCILDGTCLIFCYNFHVSLLRAAIT